MNLNTIQIRKAKQKDIKDILKLNQELSMSISEKLYKHYAAFRNVGSKKGKFFRLSKRLNNVERAFLLRLIGEYIHEKKRRISKKKFKPMFLEFCNRLFLINPNFAETIKSLAKKDFIKTTNKYIFFKCS